MLVYWLGGGVNNLITAVQWSVKSHAYGRILSIDAHGRTHTDTHKYAPTNTFTFLGVYVYKCVCTSLCTHTPEHK